MYRILDPEKVGETAKSLQGRITGIFPESSLQKLSVELTGVAEMSQNRSKKFGRPNWVLRFLSFLIIMIGLAAIVAIFSRVRITEGMWRIENFLEEVNAAIGSVVFLGAAILFLVSLENRYRRNRALRAINELRALAHVVDMHQLTKDPDPILLADPERKKTTSKDLGPYMLCRYLDYCSELLSIISKISAVYAQGSMDPVVLVAVDQIEDLTTGLSRKIWQKIMILQQTSSGPK